jgi:hypothetical protein
LIARRREERIEVFDVMRRSLAGPLLDPRGRVVVAVRHWQTLSGQQTVVAATDAGVLLSFDPLTGQERWSLEGTFGAMEDLELFSNAAGEVVAISTLRDQSLAIWNLGAELAHCRFVQRIDVGSRILNVCALHDMAVAVACSDGCLAISLPLFNTTRFV